MTPEQKQLEQVKGRLAAHKQEIAKYRNHEWAKGDALHYYEAPDDVDLLLSLVKSQAADALTPFCAVHAAIEQNGGLTLEVGNDCVACSLNERSAFLNLIEPFAADDKSEDSLTVLQKIINGAPMRSACVEKVKAKAKREREFGAEHNLIRAMAFESLAAELESLSIEKQK